MLELALRETEPDYTGCPSSLQYAEFGWFTRPIGDDGVKRYNPDALYTLGFHLSPLRLMDAATTFDRASLFLVQAQICLRTLEANDRFDISHGTRDAARKLADLLQHMVRTVAVHPTTDPDMPIGERTIGPFGNAIRDALALFENRFTGDCTAMNLYSLPRVQDRDTNILLSRGESLLPETWVPELLKRPVATADTREAAKCLALSLWTAAGFHIARATESLIQEYWLKVRHPAQLPKQRTWVALCRELQGRPATANKSAVESAGNKRLVTMMIAVGTEMRNPLIHPDHTLNDSDGPLLVSSCQGLMTKILSELGQDPPISLDR